MGPIDAFWHLANFFAPALGLAVIAASLAKLLWRASLRGVAWGRLCGWAAAVSAGVLIAGLVAFGRDGKMATYATMVVGCGLTLWATGFAQRR